MHSTLHSSFDAVPCFSFRHGRRQADQPAQELSGQPVGGRRIGGRATHDAPEGVLVGGQFAPKLTDEARFTHTGIANDVDNPAFTLATFTPRFL
ncbi:MAG: hypothetical protein IPK16_30585 [Anaerolineales bacterium]|nr:hypothetical protein [Anaerolineales bacterium]